jgi:hypothetical protein
MIDKGATHRTAARLHLFVVILEAEDPIAEVKKTLEEISEVR